MADEYLKVSPANGVRGPKRERREVKYLKPDEVQRFLDNVDERYKALFTLACLTGMRQGEILALWWGDVDLEQNVIHVRRSLYKGQIVTTKSESSDREVMLTAKLKFALKKHKIASLYTKDDDYVFPNSFGKPLDRHNLVKRFFHPALEAAGLERVPFHSLRHSFAAMLINNNQPLKLVQQLLGHSSIAVTGDIYSHILEETYEAAAEKLDAVVFGNDSTAMG